MPLDDQGIHQYVGSELAAPAPALLNRLASSTSAQVAALREKTVRTFASAAARTAAVPAPLEGAVTWLEDVNRLEVWTGSLWVRVSPVYGQLINGTTDANGIITFNHGLGATPLWAVATPFWGPMTDVLALIISVGIMAINGTIIQLRFRREDTHQFIPGNTFGCFVSYGF